MLRSLSLAAVLAAFAVFTPAAGAATVVNGNFEAGLTGWTVTSGVGSSGAWQTYTGSTPPASSGANPVVPGALGTSAIADMTGETSTILTQDVTLEPGHTHTLSLKYWYFSLAAWEVPDPLSYAHDPISNQQMVIDVVKAGTDPFSPEASAVLATVQKPAPTGPTTSDGWKTAQVDLSAFAGQTVRLRAIDVNTNNFLLVGLDDIAVESKDVTKPTLGSVKIGKTKITTTGKGAGTTFSFNSSEAGTLGVTFAKSSKGKKSGKKCVKPSKKLAKKKNCTRWAPVKGSLALSAAAGQNKLKFSGKVGRKALAAGKYRVTFILTDAAGNASTPVTKTITVVKPKKKR